MKEKRREILSIFFATFLHISYGCQMENVVLWPLPVSETILDTFRGTIISRGTSDIEAIINVNYGESTVAGPYFDVELVDSQFTIRTNNAFAQYEENEVASTVSLTVEFRCTTGPVSTNSLIFMISITDTNNNPPRFIPTNVIEFVVAPPLPPGFLLTGCYNDIIVRDIDLTTQRIEFAIEANPYLEIDYDATASTEPKEFKAVLRTTTFIRSLPEPLTFTITATDVDLTEGPPLTTTATLRIVGDSEFQFPEEPKFGQTFYLASYTETHQLNLLETISLQQGFDEYVHFSLEGENANNFRLSNDGNRVLLEVETQLPSDIWSQRQIYLIVRAVREYTSGDTATVVVELPKEETLQFDRAYYEGAIINNALQLSELILSQGYERNTITAEVIGEHSSFFTPTVQGNVVTLSMIPLTDEIIDNNSFISIQVVARSERSEATTVASLEIVKDDNVTPVFDKSIYSATYDPVTGLSAEPITFVQGFDDTVAVRLVGEHANLFQISQNGLIITLTSATIPPELFSLQNILISIEASKPRTVGANAVINIALPEESQAETDVAFEKVLFEGILQNGVVSHEVISVIGFSGSNVELHGEYSTLFEAELSNNVVTVRKSGSIPIPAHVNNVALELRAGLASAVLLLNVFHTEVPSPPTVTFSSPSYAVRVETTQTGLIGRVDASADNGEPINYALLLNNVHLEERLSVNSEGDLHLFAPVDIGDYTIQVVATTVFTQTTGTATVQLTVEAVTVTDCDDEYVVAPLIVLDVDEEEPHFNLIDVTQYDNCHFTLTNRWPSDQTWVYVDERGLHTRSIDREHESIAFMHVSQIQVEIVLHCNGDVTRTKRSIASDPPVPYDYGDSKWILADTILYNSRRSFVNIIVNDINDNAPIFVGKELEPIAVGYPVADLAETVLPRSLAELQATDADIGENAALVYWSSAAELAVSPNSGFVHVRNGAELRHGAVFSVHATDRLGEGLTGSIDLLVRLLDESHIAVVTIRDAFLEDEESVLSHLSESVGYEVKVLRSVVISDGEASEEGSRKKRDVTGGAGASLQLYVYGLIEREPVDVDRLTSDISNIAIAPVIIASTVSLQDHLEGQEICVIAGRDTGLLVATIVLSVLLFIVLVLIAVWFFLRWRRKKNYDQFSDENSLASRGEAVDVYPRPEILPKPRLDIAELKKSERRLQEMLDAPNQVITEPASSRNDAILDVPTPEPLAPIVIQSIDKLKDPADESSEDEFGETKKPKRKSVVTFNENVEKIIHVEDTDPEDISSNADFEIYKL